MKKLISILGISALIFAATGCSGDTEEVDNRTAVYIERIEKTDIAEESVYSGTVNAMQSLNIIPSATAKVQEIYVKVGDYVNEGDILCKLETTDIENNYNAAKSSYEAALAQAEAARVSYETVNGASMQMQIANAEVSLTTAEAQYTTAKLNYENNVVLHAGGAVSDFALKQSEDAFKQAEKSYEAAKIAYDMTVNVMPVENEKRAKAAYDAAVAQANAAKAQFESMEKVYNDTEVKATISGTVSLNNLTIGEYVPTTMPSFTIIQTETMKINVSVSEKVINKIKAGDEVDIKVSSISNDYIKGVIYSVAPASGMGGTYPVEIHVENKDGFLKAGMFGEIHFVTDKSDRTISIPRNAVIEKDGEKYVFVEKDGFVEKRIVTTGIDTGDKIEILSGLKINEYIVTKGQTYLNDGDEVLVSNPIEEAE